MIYTIGYQNITVEQVEQIMGARGIELLIDVRTNPYSRNPLKYEFNKNRLQERFEEQYLWLGDICGGKSGKPVSTKCIKKINEDLHEGRGFSLLLMCMENHPCDCHRLYDISRRLMQIGVEVNHLFDGQQKTTAELSEMFCKGRRKK